MKSFGLGIFVFRGLGGRIVAAICFFVAIGAVQVVRRSTEEPTSQILVQIPSQREEPQGTRKLNEYDQFGKRVEDCSWMEGRERRECTNLKNGARKFFYDHWVAKKQAYLELESNCIDCLSLQHLFIEPNEQDVWLVSIRSFIPYRGYSFERSYTDSIEVGLKIRRATAQERKELDTRNVLVFVDGYGKETGIF